MATVHLVDIFGNDVPAYETGIPPHDPNDPACWPESVELDAIHYEVSDPAERAELERIAIEAQADLSNGLTPDPWHAMMVAGSLPAISGGSPESEPSPADRDDFDAWLDQVDATYPPDDQVAEVRRWYDSRPSFSAWLESEGGAAVG